MIELSEEQSLAISTIKDWFDNGTTLEFKLGGYAGTGKTTVIKEILAAMSDHAVVVAAFTGKAVSVLRKKGVSEAQTIHSLIYKPEKLKDGSVRWIRNAFLDYDLIIIDEASMISRQLYEDLTSFDIKILWVGDPGQLEPVGDDVALMKSADFLLHQIHRQAENSPILDFATHCRLGQAVKGHTQPGIRLEKLSPSTDIGSVDVVLCGFNRTRVSLNNQIRRILGRKDKLEVEERLICLKNDTGLGIFNGMSLTLKELRLEDNDIRRGSIAWVRVEDDLGRSYGPMPMWMPQLGQIQTLDIRDHKINCSRMKLNSIALLDYGYALTVHKSQGSEWDKVAVIEEIWEDKWNPNRWRYTAITRAAKELSYFYK